MADNEGLVEEGPVHRPAKRRGICQIIAGIYFAVLIAGAVAILVTLCIVVGQTAPRVETSCGVLEGVYNPRNGIYSFKGIPFAVPPVGQLRWRPPELLTPATCWKGVLSADHDPPQCAQNVLDHTVTGQEDCLYLSIITPSIDIRKPRPVMVYIHGGYLQFGNGSQQGYVPNEVTADELEVVFVNIQYRLSIFGFLVLDELSGTGNYGILDQIAALKWIRSNIANFGGDPNQVTIFGQSSGATSIWALMTSPLARGLFQRVWMLSGSPILNKTLADARVDNREFVAANTTIRRQCGDNITETCLYDMSVDDLMSSIPKSWDVFKDSMDLPVHGLLEPALIVIDGHLLPEPPLDIWQRKSGNYSDVPLIVGSTAQELDLDPAPRNIARWTERDYISNVTSRLGTFSQQIANKSLFLYPWYEGDRIAELQYTTMASDIRITCGLNDLTLQASNALTSPVYRYIITSIPSSPVRAFGLSFDAKYAFHGWDNYAFMGSHGTLFKDGARDSDNDFSRILRLEIMNFVRNGKVFSSEWKTYPASTALISDKVSVSGTEYAAPQCEFFNKSGLLSYGWIN